MPAALLLAGALIWLAEPLSELYPDPSYPFYPGLVNIHPEPREAVSFLIAVAVPLLLVAVVAALGSAGPIRPWLLAPVICVQLAAIAFVAWSVLKQRDNLAPGFLGSFSPTLLPPGNLIAGPVIGAALAGAAIGWEGRPPSWARRLAAALGGRGWLAPALAVVVTAVWLLPGVIPDAALDGLGLIPPGHVPIEFNEFAAAANGRTPLVDYVPWYSALLPVALGPVFPVFDLSITSFTAAMTLLSLIGLTAVYGALREVTGRAWTALALYLPFMALALQPWSVHGNEREFNGSYFAILPARYFGPFVVIWLCARHLRRGSPPLWVLFGVAGLTLLNNIEFGAACLFALVVGLALGADREVPLGRWARERAGQAAVGLAGALALVCAITLVRAGELPDPALVGYAARLAGRGYTLAPMPEWGFHWVLYATYAAALLTAAVRFANRAPDRTLTGMLAFAGAFGLATGGYFAGRSLPWQLWGLFPAWALALALLGWCAWLALRSARSDRVALRRLLPGAVAALAGFGVMVASLDRFPAPWQQIDRISTSGFSSYDHYDEQLFIESRTGPGERVLIIGWELEHRLAERAGVVNVSPWFSTAALLSPNETERAIDQLEEEGGRRVFVRFVQFFSSREVGSRILAMLRERGYEVVASDPIGGTFELQRVPPPDAARDGGRR